MATLDELVEGNLFAWHLEHQQTPEFKAEEEAQRRLETENNTKAVRKYNKRYPHARLTRKEAQQYRGALFTRQNGLCRWCGEHLDEKYVIDHILPISKGGTSEIDNLCVCHFSCNARKGDRTIWNGKEWLDEY